MTLARTRPSFTTSGLKLLLVALGSPENPLKLCELSLVARLLPHERAATDEEVNPAFRVLPDHLGSPPSTRSDSIGRRSACAFIKIRRD